MQSTMSLQPPIDLIISKHSSPLSVKSSPRCWEIFQESLRIISDWFRFPTWSYGRTPALSIFNPWSVGLRASAGGSTHGRWMAEARSPPTWSRFIILTSLNSFKLDYSIWKQVRETVEAGAHFKETTGLNFRTIPDPFASFIKSIPPEGNYSYC